MKILSTVILRYTVMYILVLALPDEQPRWQMINTSEQVCNFEYA